MNPHVLDTNVLLVASAADPGSPWDDSDHVPPEHQLVVLKWLSAFRVDAGRKLVLDNGLKFCDEYRNKLTDQDYGLQVIHEKMQAARFVEIEWDSDDGAPGEPPIAAVPEAFRGFDRSDRKFLAAALTDPANICIVNACDTDWLYIEMQLKAAGVNVIHVIEDWLREQKAKK